MNRDEFIRRIRFYTGGFLLLLAPMTVFSYYLNGWKQPWEAFELAVLVVVGTWLPFLLLTVMEYKSTKEDTNESYRV